MEEPLISVIVPVYKVEPYLDKCISSIVNQTYRNLEIILVDDGSPDNCPAICDAWAEKDSRIRVIHQKNQGGGAARNAGFDVAIGKYIGLVDSDDYIEAHMYEHLIGFMDEYTDIAECTIEKVVNDDERLDNGDVFEKYTFDTRTAMQLHIMDVFFKQTPPNKLYRRKVIDSVPFPVGKSIDDEFWTYRVIANARKLVHSTCKMYAYRQQPKSVMHSMPVNKRIQAVEAKIQLHEYIQQKFPELFDFSVRDLWFTCIYQGQLAMRELDADAVRSTMADLTTVLKENPISMRACNTKEKLWLILARKDIRLACCIRNILKIGL